MSVRQLKPEEATMCVEGGIAFFDEGKLPGGFVPEVFIRNWKNMISSGRGVIIGSFDGETITGALGAVMAPDLNNDQLLATECFWFVFPQYRGHGIRLLTEFERWAKAAGARRAAMVHLQRLQPESLGALYERMGYEKIETNYLKEL